jgi:hypothetical protein
MLTNKRSGYCIHCGHLVPPGNELFRWYNQAEDVDEWRVAHADHSICERNIAADKAADEARQAYKAHLANLRERFQNAEKPEVVEAISGETYLDTRSVYGAGEAFVVTDTHVWHIRANGMDGDDWARNNYAGSIAKRLPATDELVAAIKSLAAEREALKAES